MKVMKRALAVALSLMLAVIAVGCSTPAVAISVGGYDYSTAEYLAYLYQNTNQIYQYYSYFGDVSTIWSQSMPYENPYAFGDEDETSEVSVPETTTTATGSGIQIEDKGLLMADYIKQATQDQIVYFAALQALLDENKLAISDEDLAEADSVMASQDEAKLLEKGFSLDNFRKAYINNTYLEDTVFNGLYGLEGKTPTKQADIDKYFNDNYVSYEVIQMSLEDTEGNALTDAEIAEKKESLEEYRNVFYATGDFDKAIAVYDADTTADSEEKPETSAETEEQKAYDGEPAEDVTSATSQNIQTTDMKGDNVEINLLNKVKEVKFGQAEIVEYTTVQGTKMAALVYRVNPDAKGSTIRENNQDAVLRSLHQDDFEKAVKAKMDAQKDSVNINKRAVKMCNPEDFVG